MRKSLKSIALVASALTTLTFVPQVVSAQHIGVRGGINLNDDSNTGFVGGHLQVPISGALKFYPSLNVYFPDAGSLLGLNVDLKYDLPATGAPGFYLGGGLGIMRASYRGAHDNNVGANLLFGLESRTGPVHPFGEARVLVNDNTSFELVGGLNFAIGGSSRSRTR